MTKEFDKGREYQRNKETNNRNFWFGWTTIIMAPIWYFFSVWDINTRINGWAGLTLFGSVSLLLAYSEKKELKKYDKFKRSI